MEREGSSVLFLLCKVGITFAAIAFIGFALSVNMAAGRLAERKELELIAKTVTSTIEKIEGLPCESECYREFPPAAEGFEISITGELIEGSQIISVQVSSVSNLERSLVLGSIVNNGYFRLSMQNPRGIIVRKSNMIKLELVG